MTVETLDRTTFTNPVERITALEQVAQDLDNLYAAIGVDPESRLNEHVRLINGDQNAPPRTRRILAETVKSVVAADVQGTIALTAYRKRRILSQKEAIYRQRAFSKRDTVFKASKIKSAGLNVHLR